MKVAQAPSTRNQKGYSLVEALVVVALIGIFSVIAVPNFMQMYRSGRLKTSLRNFTSDMRWARQTAVSNATIIGVSMDSTTGNTYRFYRFKRNAVGTVVVDDFLRDGAGHPVVRTFEETVNFAGTTFTDTLNTTSLRAADAGACDIVFLENGTLRTGAGIPRVRIRTSFDLPKSSYNVIFSTAGGVRAQ